MAEQPGFIENLISGVQNLPQNVWGTIQRASQMNAKEWIRIIIVIGTYLLIRPYLLKFAAKAQEKEHDKVFEADEKKKQAKISPNSLRGQVEVPDDTDDDEDEGQASGANWGKKARKRQRQFVKKVLEEDEKRRLAEQEDQDDKDIEEFLERYTSMKTSLEE